MSGNKAIYELGQNKHGQPIRLEMLADGTFSLIREAANQRDDTAHITGLTREQVRRIGNAAHLEIGAL